MSGNPIADAGFKLYPMAEIEDLNYKIKKLCEVLERIRKLSVKDTHNAAKIDLVAILATIHSEAFIVLKDYNETS